MHLLEVGPRTTRAISNVGMSMTREICSKKLVTSVWGCASVEVEGGRYGRRRRCGWRCHRWRRRRALHRNGLGMRCCARTDGRRHGRQSRLDVHVFPASSRQGSVSELTLSCLGFSWLIWAPPHTRAL